MSDWRHELRNQLNLILYASNSAREALQEDRTAQALEALLQIENATTQCVEQLLRSERET